MRVFELASADYDVTAVVLQQVLRPASVDVGVCEAAQPLPVIVADVLNGCLQSPKIEVREDLPVVGAKL